MGKVISFKLNGKVLKDTLSTVPAIFYREEAYAQAGKELTFSLSGREGPGSHQLLTHPAKCLSYAVIGILNSFKEYLEELHHATLPFQMLVRE
jgi:hypothetical protein